MKTTGNETCVCTTLSGCTGTRWACYDLASGCPPTLPQSYSSCSTANLNCDYARSDGTADMRTCDGTEWNPGTTTTYCP